LLLTTLCIGVATGQAWAYVQQQVQDRRAVTNDASVAGSNEGYARLSIDTPLAGSGYATSQTPTRSGQSR
jgi:hypothetical protein